MIDELLDPRWLLAASTWVLPVLIAVTFHEAAHGFAASLLGDDTARRAGRVSANPLRHVDPVGTVILPLILLLTRAPFLFGWAKPVPVNFARLRSPRLGMILVAAAGPATNLTLALVSALLVHLALAAPDWTRQWLLLNLEHSLMLNLVLAVFNMLPLPPLDGGRVAVGILPRPLAWRLARLERFGILLVLGLLFLLPMAGEQVGLDLDIAGTLIGLPVAILADLIITVAGLD